MSGCVEVFPGHHGHSVVGGATRNVDTAGAGDVLQPQVEAAPWFTPGPRASAIRSCQFSLESPDEETGSVAVGGAIALQQFVPSVTTVVLADDRLVEG